MKSEEQKIKEKAVKDLIELMLDYKTPHEIKRNSMFLLLTQYSEYLYRHFGKEKHTPEYLELAREVKASTIYCLTISGFDENGTPLFESKYILLHENATLQEKCEIIEQLRSFAADTIELNNRWENYQLYEPFKEKYIAQYISEFTTPKNYDEYFELPKEVKPPTICCPIITGFDENGYPRFSSKYISLRDNTTTEEKCAIIAHTRAFAEATLELNRKYENSKRYEQFKEEYLQKYASELAKEENKWICERFFPEIKTRKRLNN